MEDTIESLTLNGFKKWLDMYGQASEDGDPKAAVELFTQNAEYYETPSPAEPDLASLGGQMNREGSSEKISVPACALWVQAGNCPNSVNPQGK